MIDTYDEINIYCKMLGHDLAFNYCRSMKEGLPCRSIMNCWFEKIDINTFMNDNFTEKELEIIFEPPKEKVTSLIELIEKAKKNSQTIK